MLSQKKKTCAVYFLLEGCSIYLFIFLDKGYSYSNAEAFFSWLLIYVVLYFWWSWTMHSGTAAGCLNWFNIDYLGLDYLLGVFVLLPSGIVVWLYQGWLRMLIMLPAKKKYTDNIATLSFLFYSLTLNIMLTSLYFLSGIIQIIIYHFSSLGNKTRHLTVFFFWEDTWSFVNHDLSFSTASKATPNHPSFSTLGCTCCIWFYSFILRIQFEKSFTFTFAL